jgi:type II secretory pathway pseudopilin PulG
MRRSGVRRLSDGFSLAEVLIIIVVMGILVAISAPSIAGLVDGTRLAEAVVDVRSAFMETQRQAIRTSKSCIVELDRQPGDSAVRGACLQGGERELIENIRIDSNIGDTVTSTLIADSCGNGGGHGYGNNCENGGASIPSPYPPIRVSFGILGTARFEMGGTLATSDATGQIIFSLNERPSIAPRCLAISSTLGLTRTGIYRGTWPNGACNASETGR